MYYYHAQNHPKLNKNEFLIFLFTTERKMTDIHACLLIRTETGIYFIDSLKDEIEAELLDEYRDLYVLPRRLQNENSYMCGFYTIYFAMKLLSGKSFESILLDFKNVCLSENDHFV